jgi:L-ascorbate metabolism protein UlaG (beta-lactamase superfamily)
MTDAPRREAPPLRREGFHHIGNSTHWIVLEGVAILTDPWIAEPADGALLHRLPAQPLPCDPDVVLITHRHGDHFDPAALARLTRGSVVLLPAGKLRDRVRALGFDDVRGVTAGDRLEVRGLAIDVVRGKHSVPEVCYRVERNGRAFFFGGDTMLTPEIEALAAAKPASLVILPGERSTLFGLRFVMVPAEAIGLARRFGARQAVLTHHEQTVADRWFLRLVLRIPPPDPAELPEWFTVPVPGDFIAFPWAGGAVVSSVEVSS